MKHLVLPLVLALVLSPRSESEPPELADIVFVNGKVYTVNDAQPQAEAIAIKGERIVFVGSNAEANKYSGPTTRTIDLKGKTVVPGFTDSHYHIFGVGHQAAQPSFDETTSRGAVLARVKAEAEEGGPGKWITGRGWIETFWKPAGFLNREELDKVAPANPVFLERIDGHGAVANSKALQLAGIDPKTPDPFGGKILHDKKTGEPTGMLLDNAMDLVATKIPPPTPEEKGREFLLGVQRTIALGWCEIQNAGSDLAELALMLKLYDEGKVKLRIYNAVYGPGEAAEKILKDGPMLDRFDHHFTTRTIKVIFDGSLGSRSAALLQPYADAETSGFLTQKEDDLRPMFARSAAPRHPGRDARHRRPRQPHHPRSLRRGIQSGSAWRPQSEGTTLAGRARTDPESRPTSRASQSWALIASMQPSHAISDLILRPGSARGERDWPALMPGRVCSRPARSLPPAPTRRSNAASR